MVRRRLTPGFPNVSSKPTPSRAASRSRIRVLVGFEPTTSDGKLGSRTSRACHELVRKEPSYGMRGRVGEQSERDWIFWNKLPLLATVSRVRVSRMRARGGAPRLCGTAFFSQNGHVPRLRHKRNLTPRNARRDISRERLRRIGMLFRFILVRSIHYSTQHGVRNVPSLIGKGSPISQSSLWLAVRQ